MTRKDPAVAGYGCPVVAIGMVLEWFESQAGGKEFRRGRPLTEASLHARIQVNPNIKKEKWTGTEDAQLSALVAEHGSAWAEIARAMSGRTDQQCMGRWRRHLDPCIRRDAWAARCACMVQ